MPELADLTSVHVVPALSRNSPGGVKPSICVRFSAGIPGG